MHLHHYNVITSCLYQLAVVSYHVLLISYHYVIWYVYMVSRFWSQRFLLIFSVVQFVPKCPKSSDQSANELQHPDPVLPGVLPGCPSRMLRELLKVFLFCTKVLSKVKLETNQKQILLYKVLSDSPERSDAAFPIAICFCMYPTATSAMEDVTKVVQSLHSLSQKMSKVWHEVTKLHRDVLLQMHLAILMQLLHCLAKTSLAPHHFARRYDFSSDCSDSLTVRHKKRGNRWICKVQCIETDENWLPLHRDSHHSAWTRVTRLMSHVSLAFTVQQPNMTAAHSFLEPYETWSFTGLPDYHGFLWSGSQLHQPHQRK